MTGNTDISTRFRETSHIAGDTPCYITSAMPTSRHSSLIVDECLGDLAQLTGLIGRGYGHKLFVVT
jgi:hypothetical protein